MENFISVQTLLDRLAAQSAFTLLDVRRSQALKNSGQILDSAQWLDPALWLDWKDSISKDQPVVVYCAHGHEISQALTTALSVLGHDVVYLQGGFGAWVEAGLPTKKVE